jgi:hypothetical protein
MKVTALVFGVNFLPMLWLQCPAANSPTETNYIQGQPQELNDNGAWSWFMDPRVIVDNGWLIVGSVRANGKFADHDRLGWGNVELSILNLKSRAVRVLLLHEGFEQDDHNAPGLLVLRDGHYLAAYSKHGQETKMYYRISLKRGNPFEWGPEKEYITPGSAGSFRKDSFTYCNPMRLSGENNRTYLFHRGNNLNPNYLVSDDDGREWHYGGKLFDGLHGYSPYAKYASNGRDTIHFVATEDHPRNFPNSIYHAYIRGGKIYRSDGTLCAPLSTTTNATVHPWDFTQVYRGGSNNVAWMTDIRLDRQENPVVLFTVKVNSAGTTQGHGGDDIRFHYARWNGRGWQEQEIGFAGKRLYAGEDDYTGLGVIDPQDTSIVYLSTDASIVTGEPLISIADWQRHHEIVCGITSDGGKTWKWTPVTANSTMDNLRPIMPIWRDKRAALVWMRGSYSNNRGEWTTKVMADILARQDGTDK